MKYLYIIVGVTILIPITIAVVIATLAFIKDAWKDLRE